MQMLGAAPLLLALAAAWTLGEAARLRSDGDAGKNFPVSKIINLLKDMQSQLEKEADEDEAVYDKVMCWCKTNDKEKTQMISDAEGRIQELTTTIETSGANSARLQQEITHHEEDLAKNQQSLSTATALRKTQADSFTKEEKDMLQSIRALDAAIVVISKHHGGQSSAKAFLEGSGDAKRALGLVSGLLEKHQDLLQGVLSPPQRRFVLSLAQQPSDRATFRQSYAPQSSEIFGILKEMKDTFEQNLSETQKQELADSRTYAEMKAAKEEEIRATQAALDQKKTQLAEVNERNAQAKEDIEDTRASLSADDQFLLDLKKRCAETDAEWEIRQKTRADEISAIVEAISILSADEAHDTFSKTFNAPALLQTRREVRGVRARALNVLRRAARSSDDPRMAALSVKVNLDAFTKVKAAIDQLVQELLQEKSDEIAVRDNCIEQLNQNERTTELEERTKAELESLKEGLTAQIQELKEGTEALEAEIQELTLQVKRRGEDRETENKEFQATVADQRETQRLLQKAIAVLRKVYKKTQAQVAAEASGGGAALLQAQQPEAPPPGFAKYGQNRGGEGVVGMLQTVLRDAQEMEKDAVKDEQTSQKQYEDFVKDTNRSIRTKRTAIVNKSADKAKAEQQLTQATQDLRDKVTELGTLTNTATALHSSCDFVMKNFEVRQEARDQEVEALRQAKAILSGMQSDAADLDDA